MLQLLHDFDKEQAAYDAHTEETHHLLNFTVRQPLWTCLTESLSPAEHDEIERLIGRALIAHNTTLHQEVAALIDILNDSFVTAAQRPALSDDTRRALQTPNKQLLTTSIRLLVNKLKQDRDVLSENTLLESLVRPLTARQSRLIAEASDSPASHRSMHSSSSMSLSMQRPSSRSSTRSTISSTFSSRPATPHDGLQITLPSSVSLQTIDLLVNTIRDAFQEEQRLLMEDIAYLQGCMERAADIAIAAETESDRNDNATERELADLNEMLQTAIQQRDNAQHINLMTTKPSSSMPHRRQLAHHLPSLPPQTPIRELPLLIATPRSARTSRVAKTDSSTHTSTRSRSLRPSLR